ncbi:MAG: hypothetical protein PHU75_00905 [Candidatus Nanopelagicales bacterium]|nr:hypothetical protein [Candidatus Nanopelagicales bacterium]
MTSHPPHSTQPTPIDALDIVSALRNCDPHQLAAALARCPDPALTHLAQAVLDAATRKASYPPAQVIAEADALLYQVLCAPVADANPTGITIDPATYARHTGASLAEAERVLRDIAIDESQACDQLLASGVEPNFTIEQAQVQDCISKLRAEGQVPTRQLVRVHATAVAVSAMRPDEGDQPIIYPPDTTLSPRLVSPSPKVHVLLWLDRMDANPPSVGILEERIDYLRSAKYAMGRAARTVGEMAHRPDGLSSATSNLRPFEPPFQLAG